MRLRFLAALLCAVSCQVAAADDAPLASAVHAALGKDSAFDYATVDLNHDQRPDAVVLVRGADWCGSGGCVLLIFKATPSGFVFVSRSTISAPPIRVLPSTHRGWSDLIVHSNGTGDVVLRFDGVRYPNNPSLEPAATRAQLRFGVEVLGQTPNKSFKPNPLRGSA